MLAADVACTKAILCISPVGTLNCFLISAVLALGGGVLKSVWCGIVIQQGRFHYANKRAIGVACIAVLIAVLIHLITYMYF